MSQQLIRRMTRLTLLLGIVYGILIAIVGLMVKDVVQGLPFWDDPLLNVEPIPLLAFLLVGVAGLLEWRRERLRAQFPVLAPPRGGASASQRASGALIWAMTGFGLAGVDLVGIIFSLNLSHANWPGITGVLLLCSAVVVWFLHHLSRRRMAQP
jgi:hypothetical protein